MSFLPKANSHVWSAADQVMVSGCNFLIGILLARFLGLAAFGLYAIAQMYLMYANTFQQSLVSAPMMTVIPAESDALKRAKLVRGFFGYSLGVLVVITLVVQGFAWLLGQVSDGLQMVGVTMPFIAAMIGYQLQDWLRRVLYVESNNKKVFASDVLAYGGQLLAVGWLGWRGGLSVVAALWIMATSFGIGALFIIISQRLLPSLKNTLHVIRAYGRNSRDLLISAQLQWLSSSGVISVGAGSIGQQAAGGIRVAQNLLGPVNVVFQWMDNVIPVRAAILLREQGMSKITAYLLRIGLVGVAAITCNTLLLALIDEWLMVTVYGEAYRAFAVLLVLQAIYYLFGHIYRMMSYFNRAISNTAALAKASILWAVAAVLTALWTVQLFADRGIMFALISGEVAALLYLVWSFSIARKHSNG